MRKATHKGHCQVCGSLQMLPNGELAKHGYTVDFGVFNGTCFGAGYLPFEQDISLIEHAIEKAEKQVTHLQSQVKAREGATNPNDVFHSIYDYYLGRNSRGSYRVFPGRVVMEGQHQPVFEYTYNSQQKRYRLNFGTLENTVRSLNEEHLHRLNESIKQATDYIKWQQERIQGWQPQPLIPRE